jgi:hypothetical protein
LLAQWVFLDELTESEVGSHRVDGRIFRWTAEWAEGISNNFHNNVSLRCNASLTAAEISAPATSKEANRTSLETAGT